MIGMMIRLIRFQPSVRWYGITGWTLRTQTGWCSGPVRKLKLFWNGTLIRSATGFCVFLARSVSLSSAARREAARTVSNTRRPKTHALMSSSCRRRRTRPHAAHVLLRTGRETRRRCRQRRLPARERVRLRAHDALLERRSPGRVGRPTGAHRRQLGRGAGRDGGRERRLRRSAAGLARVGAVQAAGEILVDASVHRDLVVELAARQVLLEGAPPVVPARVHAARRLPRRTGAGALLELLVTGGELADETPARLALAAGGRD